MPSSFSVAVPRTESNAPRPPDGGEQAMIQALRLERSRTKATIDESALDTNSIDWPYLAPPIEQPRRRSGLYHADEPISTLPMYLSERPRRQSSIVNNAGGRLSVVDVKENDLGAAFPHSDTTSTTVLPTIPYIDVARVQISASQIARFRRKSRIQFAALCWCLFLEGWNDGSTGPLLPAIQKSHNIGFAIVSLLFVVNCVGFVTGAFMNVWLNDKFGFGKVMVLGSLCQIITYATQSPAPPFPVMVLANGLAGFGIALQNAQANGFVASLKEHMSTKLGIMHASYGFGAFSAPLVATYFSTTRHWSFHYLISSGIAVSNTAVLILVFRFKRQDDILAEAGQEPGEVITVRGSKYRQILGLRSVHFLAVFALIYIGVEVTLGGWIVTFIIRERDGGPTAGYISSGFFGGLTLGRVGLMWLNEIIGERRVMFVYALLAIGLEVTIWVVPSMIENAVAASFIGLLLGPMFPIVVSHATHLLPRRLLTGSIGWITGVGMSGSAALPLLTGLLASRYGIGSLQPLLVGMMVTMVGVWACVPKSQRRVD